jgi:hypothetical protein
MGKKLLVGELEGNKQLRRLRHRWRCNIKIDIAQIGWGIDGIGVAQDMDQQRALVNTVMNFRVP